MKLLKKLVIVLPTTRGDLLNFRFEIKTDKNLYQIENLKIDYEYQDTLFSEWDDEYQSDWETEELTWDEKNFELDSKKLTLNQVPKVGLQLVEKFMKSLDKLNIKATQVFKVGYCDELAHHIKHYNLDEVKTHLEFNHKIEFPDDFLKRYIVKYEMKLMPKTIEVESAVVESLNHRSSLFEKGSSKTFKTTDLEIVEWKMSKIIVDTLGEL